MEGYWLIWCVVIIFILYTSGYKHIILAYLAKQELLLYMIAGLLWLFYKNNALYTFAEGSAVVYEAIVIALIPLIITLMRYRLSSVCIVFLTGALLGLFYCLYLTVFLIYRGYEPSMLEWLVYVIAINLVLLSVIERRQLLLVIVIAQITGEALIHWHQQSQYIIKIGSLGWWEFSFFLFVSTFCLNESLLFLVKRVKFFRNNKMKS